VLLGALAVLACVAASSPAAAAAGQETSWVATTLSGGGSSGEAIAVAEGTAVTDRASLIGVDAPTATGTIEYAVYSDPECKTRVASAGTVTVSGEEAPVSEAETLAPGTYYWQASYSGDEGNQPSTSPCGEEVLTVQAPGQEPIACTSVKGELRVLEGHERLRLTDDLTTSGRKRQVLAFRWSNGEERLKLTRLTSATCTVNERGGMRFIGEGEAEYEEETGYTVKFVIGVSAKGANIAYVKLFEGREKIAHFKLAARTGEAIS
jgi:hypothetical protein